LEANARAEADRDEAWRDHSFHSKLRTQAENGDVEAAWLRVFVLVDVLDHLASRVPDLQSLADYFESLLEIRDHSHPKLPTRRQLASSFAHLGLPIGRGRSGASYQQRMEQAAARVLDWQLQLVRIEFPSPLLQDVSCFLDATLDALIHAGSTKASAAALGECLSCLNLLPPRARPRSLTPESIISRLAIEARARAEAPGASVDRIRQDLEDSYGLGQLTLRDLATSNPDLVRIVHDLTPGELEAVAERLATRPRRKAESTRAAQPKRRPRHDRTK